MSDTASQSPLEIIDLDSCDREPIHIIGSIQPHGALIAADQKTLLVEYASANAASFIGRPAEDIIGNSLETVLGPETFALVTAANLTPAQPDYLRPWFSTLSVRDDATTKNIEFYAHTKAGKIIVELVEAELEPTLLWDQDGLRQSIITQLVQPNAMDELARVSADIVRTVTGFDRVMIYRFAADKHGEVIAESTNRADSFLGLHYPASDIPEPARKHFLSNIIRYIPDISAEPMPIYMASGEAADANSSAPLDLTYAKLRGVSPVHIQYLKNMGVGASLSISLITNNHLWGLIACHHYAPRSLSSSRIRFSELLGATISTLLQSIQNTEQLQHN
ncbi:MAG: GAF domain-containing protein, partial [Alphaproteobacteria bacterium]|nr:GAF domain-containing protein [Alphaproteobacteria bacterium]